MMRNKARAFSMAEILVAMGIIGILCISMLSLNSMTDNNAKVATTKLAQVDSALKSWGKAISKTNETGHGALEVITSQETLTDSISTYFNNKKVGEYQATSTLEADGVDYSGSTTITLGNGVDLQVKYLTPKATIGTDNNSYSYNRTTSSIAVIKASIDVKGAEKTLSESYIVKATGVESYASMYEGWTKFEKSETIADEVITDPTTGETITKRTYTTDDKNANTDTIVSDVIFDNIYAKVDSTTPCGDNQTGMITTLILGTPEGTYNHVTNTCCPTPQLWNAAIKECDCTNANITEPGYYKVRKNISMDCKALAEKGSYAINGNRYLCAVADKAGKPLGHQCQNTGMSEPEVCLAGYYCPNDKTETINSNYHSAKYILNDKKVVTKVLDGGLINAIICPAGSYCPKDGTLAPSTCMVGHYCPEGTITPIPCPAGTYNPYTGQKDEKACLPCPANTYSDKAGANLCSSCPFGQWTQEKGSTICSSCPAGTYFNTTKSECSPCPKGTYQDKAGQLSCVACPEELYQDEEGQTSCKICPANSKVPKNTTDVTSVAACKCVAGYGLKEGTQANPTDEVLTGKNVCKQTGLGQYSPVDDNTIYACDPGTYQNQKAAEMCIDCPLGTYQDKAGQTACIDCPCGMYQDNEGQSLCKYCAAAKPNTYNPNTRSTSADACIPPSSENGYDYKIVADDNIHFCKKVIICKPGEYRTGDNECTPCGCGTWNDKADQTACTACSDGTYFPGEGATSQNSCIPTDEDMVTTSDKCAQKKMECGAGTYKTYKKYAKMTLAGPLTYTWNDDKPITNISYTYTGNTHKTYGDQVKISYTYININNRNVNGSFNIYLNAPKNNAGEYTSYTVNKNLSVTANNVTYKGKEIHDFITTELRKTCVACPCGTYNENGIDVDSCTACPNGTYYEGTGAKTCLALPADKTATSNKCSYLQICPKVCYSGRCWDMIPAKDYCQCPHMSITTVKGGHFSAYQSGTFTATGGGYTCTGSKWVVDPVVLDFNNDGIKLTSADDGISFDLNADGSKEQTAWTDVQTEFDDAFLCLDRNNNGQIDNGSELFGEQQGEGAETGMDELAKYDMDNNKVINKDDAIFDQLILWVDFNKNGIVDYDENGKTEEIKTLKEMGITELSVESTTEYDQDGNIKTDEHGNQIGVTGTFKRILENGQEFIGKMIDAFFQTIQVITEFVGNLFE